MHDILKRGILPRLPVGKRRQMTSVGNSVSSFSRQYLAVSVLKGTGILKFFNHLSLRRGMYMGVC